MQVHYSMDSLPEIASPVVTIGSFDGVHAGHRVIVGRITDLAKQAGGSSVLITFFPHPRMVLYPDSSGHDLKLISSQKEKKMLLSELGLDHLIILEFTREFARTSPDDFVKDYLVGKLHAHTIVVGFNHYFGYKREGSYASLYKAGDQYGFFLEEIPEQEIQNETVSSTRIRKALKEGNIQRANAYLEHHYMILAQPEPFTWNGPGGAYLCYSVPVDDPLKLLPPEGSYATSYKCNGAYKKALVHIIENTLYLFPVEPGAKPVRDEGVIRFHSRLILRGNPDVSRRLEAVEELIY